MSDEILTVPTPFADVVSLAQGYVNRADGERLLLPLPVAYPEGTGLRFVVLLADGTPAFAGAGLCSQVSDQGSTVAFAERYETLLDTLQFDDRSRPVYEYIVAVRNASYAGDDAAEAHAVEVGEGENEVETFAEPEAEVDEYAPVEDAHAVITSHAPVAPAYEDPSEQVLWSADQPSHDSDRAAAGPSWTPSGMPPAGDDLRSQPSFIPPPVPTGLLIRPARVAHWQPAPPARPTPRPVTGMFRYAAGPLPKPARPPRPQLDPALHVRPAARP